MISILRYALLCCLSGIAWGLMVWQIIFEGIPSVIVGGVIASPLIGLGLGMATRQWYRWPPWVRIGASLLSLYVAAVLFAIAEGTYECFYGDMTNRIPSAVILQTVMGYLWGLTLTGYLFILWPLAYLNHWLVAFASPDRLASNSSSEAMAEGEGGAQN